MIVATQSPHVLLNRKGPSKEGVQKATFSLIAAIDNISKNCADPSSKSLNDYMAINYSPKPGEILECHFGDDFPRFPDSQAVDHAKLSVNTRMPPEMVKNRLVVVLNGKLNDGCLVVPLSSSMDQDKISRKLHVEIPSTLIPDHPHFKKSARWATGEQVQQVSKKRLNKLHGSKLLPRELVTAVQYAVIRAINASALVASPPVA